MKTILMIDDDTQLSSVVSEYLAKFQFKVLTEDTPSRGMRVLKSTPVDLVILDVMLPEKSGTDVCRDIRKESDVPVIMLTARGDVTDRIIGLEIGADDYLSKPFEPRELVARIEAILRRPRFVEKRKTLRFKDLEVNLREKRVSLGGKDIPFTTMEFEVLSLLAGSPGEVFTRDQIMDHLRGVEYEAFTRTIDVVMSRLRSKLKDDSKSPRFIKTIWGSGYTFLGGSDG